MNGFLDNGYSSTIVWVVVIGFLLVFLFNGFEY